MLVAGLYEDVNVSVFVTICARIGIAWREISNWKYARPSTDTPRMFDF